MPIHFISDVIFNGWNAVPYVAVLALKTLPWLIVIWLLKWYFGGAKNASERLMHSKVIMITVYLTSDRIQIQVLTLYREELLVSAQPLYVSEVL